MARLIEGLVDVMAKLIRATILAVCVGLPSLGLPSLAAADALVVVEVRTPDNQPADGRVILRSRSGEGPEHSCTTTNGQCRIDAVPGGRYIVRFEPAGGPPPPPQSAMIPPEGRVTLRVSSR